jgi:hypothetical protein
MNHKSTPETSTANFGFEQRPWLAANKLRNNMDAEEPKRSGESPAYFFTKDTGQPAADSPQSDCFSVNPSDLLSAPPPATRASKKAARKQMVLEATNIEMVFLRNSFKRSITPKHPFNPKPVYQFRKL